MLVTFLLLQHFVIKQNFIYLIIFYNIWKKCYLCNDFPSTTEIEVWNVCHKFTIPAQELKGRLTTSWPLGLNFLWAHSTLSKQYIIKFWEYFFFYLLHIFKKKWTWNKFFSLYIFIHIHVESLTLKNFLPSRELY